MQWENVFPLRIVRGFSALRWDVAALCSEDALLSQGTSGKEEGQYLLASRGNGGKGTHDRSTDIEETSPSYDDHFEGPGAVRDPLIDIDKLEQSSKGNSPSGLIWKRTFSKGRKKIVTRLHVTHFCNKMTQKEELRTHGLCAREKECLSSSRQHLYSGKAWYALKYSG